MAETLTPFERELSNGVSLLLEKKKNEIIEEIILKAKDELSQRIRAEVNNVALNISNWYAIERYGNDIRVIIYDKLKSQKPERQEQKLEGRDV